MTDFKLLEKRIDKLEKRVEKLEGNRDRTEALYEKARELVVKHNKAPVIFLQRKLMIDWERAENILDELQANGVIGSDWGIEPRKIIIKR